MAAAGTEVLCIAEDEDGCRCGSGGVERVETAESYGESARGRKRKERNRKGALAGAARRRRSRRHRQEIAIEMTTRDKTHTRPYSGPVHIERMNEGKGKEESIRVTNSVYQIERRSWDWDCDP